MFREYVSRFVHHPLKLRYWRYKCRDPDTNKKTFHLAINMLNAACWSKKKWRQHRNMIFPFSYSPALSTTSCSLCAHVTPTQPSLPLCRVPSRSCSCCSPVHAAVCRSCYASWTWPPCCWAWGGQRCRPEVPVWGGRHVYGPASGSSPGGLYHPGTGRCLLSYLWEKEGTLSTVWLHPLFTAVVKLRFPLWSWRTLRPKWFS